MRQDAHGDRHGHAGVREGHAGEVLHRVVAGDAFAAGARDENRLDAELRAIGRARLLVIDELGYLPIDIDGARLLFQVVADSYEKRSVVFTTNLEFGRWGEVFGDGDMAAAVIDRIVHHGRIVRFRGESYRNSHSLMK